MDHKLTKQFTYIHQNTGDHRVRDEIITNLRLRCGISIYGDAVTITCSTIGELGGLAVACTEEEKEGIEMQFFGAISRKLVKFIGG